MKLTTFNTIYIKEDNIIFKNSFGVTKIKKINHLKSFYIDSKFTSKIYFEDEFIVFNTISYKDQVLIKEFLKEIKTDIIINN